MAEKKRLKNISYLRVFACLGVVCTHLGQKVGVTGKLYEVTHYLQHSVFLFFIISGFLALYTYSDRGYTLKKYWTGRLLRILPVYYAIILYDFVLCSIILNNVPADEYHLGWLRYIFLISYSVPGSDFWSNISFTWTVSIFALFYLLVPFVNKFVKTYRASWIALLVTYFLMDGLQRVYGYFGVSTDWARPLFYMIYFMFGVVICRAVQYGREKHAMVIFGALMLYYMSMSRFTSPYTLSFLLCIIMLASMGLEFKNVYVQKAFDTLDKYSYEIYLGHAVAIEAIDYMQAMMDVSTVLVLAIGIGGTAVVSVVLYHFVDRPVNRFFAGRSRKA